MTPPANALPRSIGPHPSAGLSLCDSLPQRFLWISLSSGMCWGHRQARPGFLGSKCSLPVAEGTGNIPQIPLLQVGRCQESSTPSFPGPRRTSTVVHKVTILLIQHLCICVPPSSAPLNPTVGRKCQKAREHARDKGTSLGFRQDYIPEKSGFW